jgi:hypothetical protein
MVMYDVTTLHFEVTDEDEGPEGLRKVGMSKEHRVDPHVQVGLLVDPTGFPLEAYLFEGNTAETKTVVPVLEGFQRHHQITDLVVVADAGMLSAGKPERDRGCRVLLTSSAPGSPRLPTTWPSTSRPTATTSPTARSSSPRTKRTEFVGLLTAAGCNSMIERWPNQQSTSVDRFPGGFHRRTQRRSSC